MVVEEEEEGEGGLEVKRDLDFETTRKRGIGEFLGTGSRGWDHCPLPGLAGWLAGWHLPQRTGGI